MSYTVKKQLLRVLLSLLIGTQTAPNVMNRVVSIDMLAEEISSTSMSEAELYGYLQAQGISLDMCDSAVVSELYEVAGTEVMTFATSGTQATEAVNTSLVPSSNNSLVEISPITAEEIGGIDYVKGGYVTAVPVASFVATVLGALGVNMYGNYQFETDADFRADYVDLVKDRLNNFVNVRNNLKQYAVENPDEADKIYSQWLTYAQRTLGYDPSGLDLVEGLDTSKKDSTLRFYLTEEDAIKMWNGEEVDYTKYCTPDRLSTKTIWRVWKDEAKEFYAGGISQFFNKKEIENIAYKLYEEQGVTDRYDIAWEDYNVGDNPLPDTTYGADPAIIQDAVNRFNSIKKDINILPLAKLYVTAIVNALHLTDYDNFISVNINGYQTDDTTYSSTTQVNIYAGRADVSTPVTMKDVTWSINPGQTVETTGYDISGNFRSVTLTVHPSSDSITTNSGITRVQNVVLGRSEGKDSIGGRTGCGVHTSSLFIDSIEEDEPSSLIDWATSNLKFPTLDEVRQFIGDLPFFQTHNVNPSTGEEEVQDWVKLPFLKKIKDKIDEHYNDNDFQDDVDLSDEAQEDELPDYVDKDTIQNKSEKDVLDDYTKPYDTDTEKPETTRPSPTDVVVPPKYIPIPSMPSTVPTGGGTPVIIPPIIPVGGSSSALFSVYNPTASEIDALGSYLWGSSIVELLSKFLQNPIDAVISLHQIYITPTISGRKNIKLGYLDSGVGADCVSQQYESLDCGVVFVPEYFNDARDYSPWTQVQIYLPFIGIVPLSTEDIIGSIVNVKYGIDVYTGALLCTITVTKPDGTTQTLYTYEGSGSVQYPLTTGNIKAVLSGYLGALTGACVGGLTGAMVGGLTGAYSGGYSVSRSSGFSGNSGAMSCKKPYIIISRKIPDDAFNYPSYYGLPANKTVNLASCSGYTRVKDVNLDSLSATEREKQEIDTLLKQGILV